MIFDLQRLLWNYSCKHSVQYWAAVGVQDCLLQMSLMYIGVGAGNEINAKIPVTSSSNTIHIQTWRTDFFFVCVYHDTGYTRSVFEHDVQPHHENHTIVSINVGIKGRENKVCGGVSQFSSKQGKIQRDLESSVLCVFCKEHNGLVPRAKSSFSSSGASRNHLGLKNYGMGCCWGGQSALKALGCCPLAMCWSCQSSRLWSG